MSSPETAVPAAMNRIQRENGFGEAFKKSVVERQLRSDDEMVTPPRSDAAAMRPRQQEDAPGSARKDEPIGASESRREQRTEPRTEVHISIGTIELRASRAEARPQPAPFNPRVTLSDFLGRRS
jgi:hypothetical protein